MSSNNDLSSVSINDIISKNDKKNALKDKRSKKTDNCQELKNLAYKTMLLNGNDINPKFPSHEQNSAKITNFLESESSANKKESWCRLDKTQKINRLNIYSEKLKVKYNLTDNEFTNLRKYFIRCLDRKNLSKTKDIIYNKENNEIDNIPHLCFNEDTRSFILKKDDKHVSTVKSLPDKKHKPKKTIKIHNE